MGGLRDGTANDTVYLVLVVLTETSMRVFLPLLFCWIVLVIIGVRRRVRAKR